MQQKINVNQICKIEIFHNRRNTHFYYHEKKHFWNKKEGFYYDMTLSSDELWPESSIIGTGKNIIIGKEVYYKPHIYIYLSNEQRVTDWFESSVELERFVAEYFKDIPLIII